MKNQIEHALNQVFLIPIFLILFLFLIGCQDQNAIKTKENEELVQVQARQECTVRKKEYDKLMAVHKYWEAASELRACSETLKDTTLKKLVIEAEVKSHLQDIKNPKISANDKVRAIEFLIRDCPEEGKKYEALIPQLVAKAEKEELAAIRTSEIKAAAKRKREGVLIGMTHEDVIASSWGKPESINRTTYSWGIHEQWVYDGGYLYFENGILTAIQN